MCGILGIYGHPHSNVAGDLMAGLNSIQHRGQDSAGIITYDQTFKIKKGLGLVNQVFKEKHLQRLQAPMGLGHVRYSTMGTPDELNAQPMMVNYPQGIAMVHNGNVTNFNCLRKTLREKNHRLILTANDVELMLYVLAAELEHCDLNNLTPESIFSAVNATQQKVEGAYATLAMIADIGFLAFTDPLGIRPLVMGQKITEDGPIYAFASETTCFDYLGMELIRDLAPGEIIFIDKNRNVHSKMATNSRSHFCIFEYIYFAREDSIIHGKTVAVERAKMGELLATAIKKRGITPDLVIDVPSSSFFFAQSLAQKLNIPYVRGLAKNNFFGRSFILPTRQAREQTVRQKLNPIKQHLQGKKVAVVDDSIVRGTTSKHLVNLIKEAGASKVYFISASPPICHPCVYGIDMSSKTELIAANMSEAEIARHIGADEVIYQKLESLMQLYSPASYSFSSSHSESSHSSSFDGQSFFCYACFSGNYPTEISTESLREVAIERAQAKELTFEPQSFKPLPVELSPVDHKSAKSRSAQEQIPC